MCVEFYLILKVAGAKKSLMWRLIFLSVIMLVTGYMGETGYDSVVWGTISGLAYFVIVYEIWLGEFIHRIRECVDHAAELMVFEERCERQSIVNFFDIRVHADALVAGCLDPLKVLSGGRLRDPWCALFHCP